MTVRCSKCRANISPTWLDLLPGGEGSVSIDCPGCGQSNHVHWWVSASLLTASLAIGFCAIPLLAPLEPHAIVVGIVAVSTAYLIFRLLMLFYLRRSAKPFVGNGAVGR
jgi:hypothetical protein